MRQAKPGPPRGRLVAILVCALAGVSLSGYLAARYHFVRKATAEVETSLVRPWSAKFEAVRFSPTLGMVCGRVSAESQFGLDTGASMFLAVFERDAKQWYMPNSKVQVSIYEPRVGYETTAGDRSQFESELAFQALKASKEALGQPYMCARGRHDLVAKVERDCRRFDRLIRQCDPTFAHRASQLCLKMAECH